MNVEFFVENVKYYCNDKGVSPSRACIESGAGKMLMDNVKCGVFRQLTVSSSWPST